MQTDEPTILIHDGIVFKPGLVALEYWRQTRGVFKGHAKSRHAKCNTVYFEKIAVVETT
jgi:hypothetical protein